MSTAERFFCQGNIALGWGALAADCRAFFGYPITPQNETTEWFAREFPKRGRVFVQSASETASINMLYGAGAAGIRAMTSTSSIGYGLMLETMSHAANAEVPFVVVLVQRGGPGHGTVRHAQMDYLSTTRGGGPGGYRTIVLAPNSVQENADFLQLGFHLADRYRNPVIVMTDGLIGQMMEPLEMRTLDFSPLPDPEKDWALKGTSSRRDGKRRLIISAQGSGGRNPPYETYGDFIKALDQKHKTICDQEVRFETHAAEDAELILVSYGYTSRVCKQATKMARAEGLKVGLIRPTTLWPFPLAAVRERAAQGCQFLVVEDSLGQMVEDVELAVKGRAPVHLLGSLDRHLPTDAGMILPQRVLAEVKRLIWGR